MNNNQVELSVNTEVLEKMASIAACEVDGVTGLSKKAIDIKGISRSKTPFKGVKVETANGIIKINIYICVKRDAKVRDIAEKVQQNVKDKIQTMTGNAVAQVNVNIADISFAADSVEKN